MNPDRGLPWGNPGFFTDFLRVEVRNRLAADDGTPRGQPRWERLVVSPIDKNVTSIKYCGAGEKLQRPGVFVDSRAIQCGYFEVQIVEAPGSCSLCIGIVSARDDVEKLPGMACNSVGLNCSSGQLFKDGKPRQQLAIRPRAGDRVGCGVRHSAVNPDEFGVGDVYFTYNGNEVVTLSPVFFAEFLYPAISLSEYDESILLTLHDSDQPSADGVVPMAVDSHDDDWMRLHHVKQNGQVLEYAGRGRSIDEVGLAQAKCPLSPVNHYFELEIVDPGDSCYIAIGLARKDYPQNRHPGWNLGSVAYHADDGKIFVGSGTGDPFGPRCIKGDVMGCGIIFPREKDVWLSEDDESTDESDTDSSTSRSRQNHAFVSPDAAAGRRNVDQDGLSASSDGDDDHDIGFDLYDDRQLVVNAGADILRHAIARLHLRQRPSRPVAKLRQIVQALGHTTEVQVYFTRNRKLVGKRQVCLPTGEYYPTIGMLSRGEKVHVDLRPLTG